MNNLIGVILLCFSCIGIGWGVGNMTACPPCPPCIESKACPSEEIWVNTSFGFMHFTVGEIDEAPPYIFDKQKMDEMFNQLENELLKQRGKSL